MLDCVLFDLDNTLIDRDAAFERWLEDRIASARPALGQRLRSDLVRQAQALDASGYAPREPLCTWLAEQGLADDPDAAWQALRDGIGHFVEPAPTARALIERLAAHGIAVAIVSNGSADNQRRKLAAAALADCVPPSRVLISGELGVAKPEQAIFALALERCGGIAPARAVFVGDHPQHDMAGAGAAGLRTLWLARDRTWCTTCPPPDDSVSSLDACARWLERAAGLPVATRGDTP